MSTGFTAHVDREVCIGVGTCEALAPELFAVAAGGYAAVLDTDPGPALRDPAEAAATSCPMAAIVLRDR